jgi:DNA-binding transcriptional LysR family regulator
MDRLECDRMFVAVLDTGSFTAAARRLGTSSGQASKLVARLEADLGVQLIKRNTRALAATEIGDAYYLRVKGLIEEFDALDAAVRNASGAPSGRLRVTAPSSFGTLCLNPVLIDFARAFPQIQLEVSYSDRVVSLVDEGFDAAVRIGLPPDSSLVARKLCEARIVVVAAPTYLEARGTPRMPADLTGHDCIADLNFRDPFAWSLRTAPGGDRYETIPVHARMSFSNGEACFAAAEAGLGITRVPSFIAGPSIRTGRVTRVLAGFEEPPLLVHALYPPARHLAVKVRAFVDFLAACWRDGGDWDRGW